MTVINSYASDEIFCQVTTKIHLFKPQYLLKINVRRVLLQTVKKFQIYQQITSLTLVRLIG